MTVATAEPLSRRLLKGCRGVSAVELALTLPLMLLTIFGGIELGYRMMMAVRLDGAVKMAARMATTGQFTQNQIDQAVNDLAATMKNAHVDISKRAYDRFTAVAQPEPITSDTNPVGAYNKGDCFEDRNRNGIWDNGSTSGVTGYGNPDEIIRYSVTLTYPVLFPMMGSISGIGDSHRITATTVLQNEPYGNSAGTSPPVLCN